MLTLPDHRLVRLILSFLFCLALISVGTEAKGESTEEMDEQQISLEQGMELSEQPIELEEEKKVLFADIDEEHWVFDDLEQLVEKRVLVSSPDTHFEPDKRITKADLIRLILRAKGVYDPSVPFTHSRFNDVPPESDTYPYIEIAYSMAITSGDAQGNFNPLGAISRQEAIGLMIKALGKEEEAKRFPLIDETLASYADQEEITPVYREILAYAVDQGFVAGMEREGKQFLEPRDFITRAEAAALVARFILPELEGALVETVDGMEIYFKKKMEFEATAYSSEQPNLSKYTATGLLVRHGIVSVNPEVIPFGTHLYIEGYGFAVAGDTGGSMLKNGQQIDLAFETVEEAISFGRKKVQVYFLD